MALFFAFLVESLEVGLEQVFIFGYDIEEGPGGEHFKGLWVLGLLTCVNEG